MSSSQFLRQTARKLGLAEPSRGYVTKRHRGLTIGVDDVNGRDRCVHGLGETDVRQQFERLRPQVLAAVRARTDLMSRYPHLRIRNESGPQAMGRSYVGWEWRDSARDAEDADMAVELVNALIQIWEEVLVREAAAT